MNASREHFPASKRGIPYPPGEFENEFGECDRERHTRSLATNPLGVSGMSGKIFRRDVCASRACPGTPNADSFRYSRSHGLPDVETEHARGIVRGSARSRCRAARALSPPQELSLNVRQRPRAVAPGKRREQADRPARTPRASTSTLAPTAACHSGTAAARTMERPTETSDEIESDYMMQWRFIQDNMTRDTFTSGYRPSWLMFCSI